MTAQKWTVEVFSTYHMQRHEISEVMTPDAMQQGTGTRYDKDFILKVITQYSMHTISFCILVKPKNYT